MNTREPDEEPVEPQDEEAAWPDPSPRGAADPSGRFTEQGAMSPRFTERSPRFTEQLAGRTTFGIGKFQDDEEDEEAWIEEMRAVAWDHLAVAAADRQTIVD